MPGLQAKNLSINSSKFEHGALSVFLKWASKQTGMCINVTFPGNHVIWFPERSHIDIGLKNLSLEDLLKTIRDICWKFRCTSIRLYGGSYSHQFALEALRTFICLRKSSDLKQSLIDQCFSCTISQDRLQLNLRKELLVSLASWPHHMEAFLKILPAIS